MSKKSKCPAVLKDGRPCPHTGKLEHQGYCGIHRQHAAPDTKPPTETRSQKWGRLLAASSALVILTEKAVKYLPDAIDVLVELSRLAFVRVSDDLVNEFDNEDTFYNKTAHLGNSMGNSEMQKMIINPASAPEFLKKLVQKEDWKNLSVQLNYGFDIKFRSGNVPQKLLDDIMRSKEEVLLELRRLGYEAPNSASVQPIRAPKNR